MYHLSPKVQPANTLLLRFAKAKLRENTTNRAPLLACAPSYRSGGYYPTLLFQLS